MGWTTWPPPDAFVDPCGRETLLREVQIAQWQALFDGCFQQSASKG